MAKCRYHTVGYLRINSEGKRLKLILGYSYVRTGSAARHGLFVLFLRDSNPVVLERCSAYDFKLTFSLTKN